MHPDVPARDLAELIDPTPVEGEELKSVVLPPGGWAVGRELEEIRERGADVRQ